MPKRVSAERVGEARKSLKKVRRQWLRQPDVTAVDVGYKIKDGKLTDEVAIRVHVKRKKDKSSLAAGEVLNDKNNPHTLEGLPLDILEADYEPQAEERGGVGLVGMVEAHEVDRQSRVEPLVGGLSVGNRRTSAGTLGAIVWDRLDGCPCILSSWHVLAGSFTARLGEPVRQPAVFDSGRATDTVAELKRWHLTAAVDAALAELTGERHYHAGLLEAEPILGVEEPALGMEVRKSGRSTGVTEGFIDGVELSMNLDFGRGVVQSFEDQIRIVPRPPWPAEEYEVSSRGDSGSVWIHDKTGKAVGLHCAGEAAFTPIAEVAVANRMDRVQELLKFSWLPLFALSYPKQERPVRRLLRSFRGGGPEARGGDGDYVQEPIMADKTGYGGGGG